MGRWKVEEKDGRPAGLDRNELGNEGVGFITISISTGTKSSPAKGL